VAYEDNRLYAPANALKSATTALPLSPATIRGEAGSDFEGYAAVLRGAPKRNFLQKLLPCIYDERDYITYGEAKKFVLVKGLSCFVYLDERDPAPIYAIPLQDVYAVQEDPRNLDPASVTVNPRANDSRPSEGYVTILLKYRRDGSQAYQLTFDTKAAAGADRSSPKRFVDAVEFQQHKYKQQQKEFGGGEVGGDVVTASLLHAKQVGKVAQQYQPEI